MVSYAGIGAGSYGALGGEMAFGGIISYDWFPEPEVVAARIMELSGYLENFIPPLEASKGIAKADMQNHFDTETSPEGEPWAQLNKEYVQRRRGGAAHPILQLTGKMHDAALSDSAYMIDGADLFINTGGFPDYWVYHEFGREEIAGWDVWVKEASAMLGVDITSQGGAMPARPFVGISFEAQLEIIEIFDLWFKNAVIGFYTHPGGSVQQRVSGGLFGPKIG